MNEGIDSDFFKRMYPRLQPMSHEEYRNSKTRRQIEAEERK